jgi:hypothetical protein
MDLLEIAREEWKLESLEWSFLLPLKQGRGDVLSDNRVYFGKWRVGLILV